MFQLFSTELYAGIRRGLGRKCNSFQHHGQSSEQRLLTGASFRFLETNQCFAAMVGWLFKADVCLFQWPDKLSVSTHFQLSLLYCSWLGSAILLPSQSKTRRKHFSLFMHVSFFRTQSALKRNMFLQRCWKLTTRLFPFKTFVLPVVVHLYYRCMLQVGVSALWFCSTLLLHCKAQSDTSHCGMKSSAAAESLSFDICLLHGNIWAKTHTHKDNIIGRAEIMHCAGW